jgi:hypothetical protein
MNVTFACPQCDLPARVELAPDVQTLTCPHCDTDILVPEGATTDGMVNRCLVCPSRDLFLRKDFPQRVGVLIVVIGFVASTMTWWYHHRDWTYAILFATVLVDVVLYLFVRDAVMCYRCGAQYRGTEGHDSHGAFNLETHERHRQETARRDSSTSATGS